MTDYEKELLDLLKEKYIRLFGNRPFRTNSGMQNYWLSGYEDNLIHPMDTTAETAYGEGAGNEIDSGKIGALKSSSAMTYNLFWNRTAEISAELPDARIGNGMYTVELEKKLRTLKSSAIQAHLDVFLYCAPTGEAVACEMKMTEWLFNKPGTLRASYRNPENYFDLEFGKTMAALAKELIRADTRDVPMEAYPCGMGRYDAFQMFKHVSACYTACMNKEHGEIKKITLVNCAWTLQDSSALSPKFRGRYLGEEKQEREEFCEFRHIMEPVKHHFADIGIDFDIRFYSFADLLAMVSKTPAELAYLERYII